MKKYGGAGRSRSGAVSRDTENNNNNNNKILNRQFLTRHNIEQHLTSPITRARIVVPRNTVML